MSNRRAPSPSTASNPRPDVEALLDPRNVVIVGATDKPGNWAQRCWRNLGRYGYGGPVYPLNPRREDVWGIRCYKSYSELPEPPDHLAVFVPAPFVEATLREGAAAGARSATVVSAGFDESPDPVAIERGRQLSAAIAEVGIAVSGPNCLGNFNGRAKFVTMTDNRPQPTEPGPVAIVGQSGGLVMALKRTLEERGMDVGYIVTSGNEAGLKTADYIEYFAADPQTRVIVSYLEAVREPERFLAACAAAKDAGKPVIVVKLGTSDNGRAAALAHTGGLAGSIAAFDAIAGDAGAVRVATLDDVVEMAEYFLHARLPRGEGLGAMTFSGGLRGVLLDQAAVHGLSFPPLAPKTRKRLGKLLGVGTVIGNPLDSGFAALTSRETYIRCVEAMLDDPGVDYAAFAGGAAACPRGRGKGSQHARRQRVGGPIEETHRLRHHDLAWPERLRAGPARRSAQRRLPAGGGQVVAHGALGHLLRDTVVGRKAAAALRDPSAMPQAVRKRLEGTGDSPGPAPLSEVESKALLRAYGVRTPRERLAGSAPEAARIARSIGLPVVLKAVAAELTHKSDIGGVLLNNDTMNAVRQGYGAILSDVTRKVDGIALDGVLVAEQVGGGLELVIGASRDPEMGTVVMFGSGGMALELHRDVAFAAPTLDEASADELIGRTRAARLIDGYRGAPALDRKALIKALMAVSRLARDLGDRLESIDVNPFLLRRRGGIALDALVVLAGEGTAY